MYDEIIVAGAMLALALGGVVGFWLAEIIIRCWHKARRKMDKNRIEAAMAREAYLNDLYQESLYEEVDRLAMRTAQEMARHR